MDSDATTSADSVDRRLRMLEFQIPSDLDESASGTMSRNEQHNLAKQFLSFTGSLLQTAERELQQLENEDVLGSAVVRGCAEFADAMAHVAAQLEGQTDKERRALAAACLQDFQSNDDSSLRLKSEGDDATHDALEGSSIDHNMTESDIAGALGAAVVLLRDVESALRAVEPDEAQDLADTALTVAHLFLATLQHVHSQLTPENLIENANSSGATSSGRSLQESPNIVTITEDGEEAVDRNRGSEPSVSKYQTPQRMRCLWPPIGPAAGTALQWTQEEVKKQHWLLTTALGITLWPVWTTTAVLGSTAVLVDHVLQTTYQHLEHTAIIGSAEVAAAYAYQTSKLALLTAKAVARPTLRVAKRQLRRHGPGVQEWTVHRLQHPVETVDEAARGAWWCAIQVADLVSQQLHAWQQQLQDQGQQLDESYSEPVDSERQRSVQEMQLL